MDLIMISKLQNAGTKSARIAETPHGHHLTTKLTSDSGDGFLYK